MQPQQLSSCLSLSLALSSSLSVYSVCLFLPLISLAVSHSLIIQLSPPEVSAFAFSPPFPHSHFLFCSLSLSPIPSTHPTSFSITVAWCLLAWRLPTGATGGLRSSDLEQNLSQTNKMLMNDDFTATLNRHLSDSLNLCLFSPWKLLSVHGCFVFFFSFVSVLCGYAEKASLRKREVFSIMFYSAACQVVITMGLALLPLGMLWACCFSISCLSVWLAVCPVSSHSTDWEGALHPSNFHLLKLSKCWMYYTHETKQVNKRYRTKRYTWMGTCSEYHIQHLKKFKHLIIVIKSLTSLLLTFIYSCFMFHICCLL